MRQVREGHTSDLIRIIEILLNVIVLGAVVGGCFVYFYISSWGKSWGLTVEAIEFIRSVITNLVPVGVIYIVAYFTLRAVDSARENYKNRVLLEGFEKTFSDELAELTVLVTKFAEFLKEYKAIRSVGIISCPTSLDEIKERALRLQCSRIQIMTTFFTNPASLHQLFQKTSKLEGYNIQILLLNPRSEMAKQRSRDLKELGTDNVPRLIRECRLQLEKLNIPNLEIRYYNSLPSFPLYIFGNYAYWGTFPHGKLADFAPWICVELYNTDNDVTIAGQFLIEEFERVWHSATKPND
jgi:hypothetical protein